MPDYATYHVGMKLLLWKGDEVLFLRDAQTGHLDLPGGRIDDNEDKIPLLDVLKREVTEELGPDVQYEVGPFLFQYRRFSPRDKNVRVFVNVYGGRYVGGDIELSHEHGSYEWSNPFKRSFALDDFLGEEEEHHAFVNYFKSVSN